MNISLVLPSFSTDIPKVGEVFLFGYHTEVPSHGPYLRIANKDGEKMKSSGPDIDFYVVNLLDGVVSFFIKTTTNYMIMKKPINNGQIFEEK